MNSKDFEHHLDIYGSRWERWPEHLRVDAQAFLRDNEEAKRLFAQVVELDEILQLTRTSNAPSYLRTRILANLANSTIKSSSWLDQFLTHIWRPAAVALVPLFLGFAVGFFDQESVDELEEEIVALSFTDFEMLAGVYDEP